jgi:ABC-type glycerol-3-phosphate transport system substrate-binding protein
LLHLKQGGKLMKVLRMAKLFGLVLLIGILIVCTVGYAAKSETITYWTWVPTDIQYKTIEAAFTKKYPDIKIDFWRGELPDYQKKLQVAMAAGEGPDVLGLQVGGMLSQYANFLMPVKPLADSKLGKGWENKLSSVAFAETKTKDGKVVALPINFTAQEFVLYNQAIFEECGIKNVPTTYNEWKKDCEAIRAKGYIPVALGAKDIWHDVDVFVALSNQFAPGKVYQAEAGKLKWTDKAFADTMKAWKKLFDDKIVQEGALGVSTYPDARDQYYYARKSAMFMTGTWHVGYALPGGEKFGTKIEKDPTGCFILPQMGPYESRAVASVDTAIAINKDTKHKDAAWKLFSFMTMDEGQQIMADFMQGSPSKKGIQIGTLDQFKFQSEKDAVKYTNDKISNAVGKRLLSYPELSNALGVALQDVAAGKPIEKALQEVQDVSAKIKR